MPPFCCYFSEHQQLSATQALAIVVQLGRALSHQGKFAGSVPSQGTCLGYRSGPSAYDSHSGPRWEATNQCFSLHWCLSLSLPSSLPFSLKKAMKKIFSGEDFFSKSTTQNKFVKSQFWKSIIPFILLSLVKRHQITKDKRDTGLRLSHWRQLEVQLQVSSWSLTSLPHLESAQEFRTVWEWRQNIDIQNMELKEHDEQHCYF